MDTSPLRIGYCLSLSGALASNGKTARLAHQIWQEHVNANAKLLGRPVELVCLDDQTNPKLVADIYQRLLDVEKVDVVVGGYGDNSVAPASLLRAPISFPSSVSIAWWNMTGRLRKSGATRFPSLGLRLDSRTVTP